MLLSYEEEQQPERGSLCPRHSRGLPVQGTRKALPARCLVINLSLLDLVPGTGETLPALLYTNITNRGDGRALWMSVCSGNDW